MTAVGPISLDRVFFCCPACSLAGYCVDDILGLDGFLSKSARRIVCFVSSKSSFGGTHDILDETCGMLVPPKSAPEKVKDVIAAANRIRSKPYIFGGGHARWWDRGYDCSGSVSYALHGGEFIESPLPSGPMMKWGLPGEGRWITVYANGGHAYAVIAGVRWDTSGDSGGETGPRWHTELRDNRGFVARHPAGEIDPGHRNLVRDLDVRLLASGDTGVDPGATIRGRRSPPRRSQAGVSRCAGSASCAYSP